MRSGSQINDVSPRAMKVLMEYSWPGNIRELSNVMERAVIFCDDPTIDLSHLPADVLNAAENNA